MVQEWENDKDNRNGSDVQITKILSSQTFSTLSIVSACHSGCAQSLRLHELHHPQYDQQAGLS